MVFVSNHQAQKKTDEIYFLMVKKTNDDFKSLEVGAKKLSMKVVK